MITNSYGASDGYPSQHGIIKDAQVRFSDILLVINVESTSHSSAVLIGMLFFSVG